MKSKYVVLAITLLLTLSSTASVVNATKGTILFVSAVDTHGPRISAINFQVDTSDSALKSALGSGGIQVAEWSFLAGSYTSLASNPNVAEGSTLGYTFDGIEFNTVQPIISSVHFREAIQYLTNYGSIQSVSLSGIAGSAAPYLLPCDLYGVAPASCKQTGLALESYNIKNAAIQLSESGLYAKYAGAAISTAGITALANSKLSGITWFTNAGLTKAFFPLFYYRSDDPLRTSVATLLNTAAKMVGLNFNIKGITDHEADGDVYGASEADVTTNGGYCASGPNKGYNDCPAAVLNTSPSALAADDWDMYTFGWVASVNFVFQGFFEWTSAEIDNTNFGGFINPAMDYAANTVLYSPTLSGSAAAAQTVDKLFAQYLPGVMSFYESYLYADYVNGWTGYAGEPTTGPNTGGGAFYTFLNVHKTTGIGGTITYGLHSSADIGSLNPIAYPNWVWQADLYGQIYDTPVNTPPTAFTTPNDFISWMLSANTATSGAPAGSKEYCGVSTTVGCIPGVQVASYNGLTPSGAFVFQCLPADVTHTPPFCSTTSGTGLQANIVHGQAITLTFDQNITFTDHVPLTAYDYNYSLYALNVAISPSLPTAFSPAIGDSTGPFGLWATTVQNGGYSITMYVNSTSIWNFDDLLVPVLPQHMFQYLNINVADAVEANIDFSHPYATACATVAGCPSGTAPSSILYLPNLNLASGPFWLKTIAESTGTGTLEANMNYMRSSWYDNLANEKVTTTGTISFTSSPTEYVYNAGTVAGFSPGCSTHSDCYVTLTNAQLTASNGGTPSTMSCSAWAQKFSSPLLPVLNIYTGKATGSKISLTATCSGNGHITVSITPSNHGMTAGIYEVGIMGTYTFLGQARTWYQYYGIDVT